MNNISTQPSENTSRTMPQDERIRLGLLVTLCGLAIFVIGAKPEWLGLDQRPAISFAQICIFMFGLAVICVGGSVGLTGIWGKQEKSIAADIGLRLVATGYVIAIFSGMADIFGMSVKDNPRLPFFGPWQQTGVEIGMATIAIGMLLVVPWKLLRRKRP